MLCAWALLGTDRSGGAEGAREATPDFLVDIWQTDQGLPQGTVTSIVQTQDGYLWIGTYNGLARFDGTQFRVLNPANTPGLTSARIVQLFEGRDGGLWVGAEEGQVLRLKDGTITEYETPNHGSAARMVRQMCEDAEGKLWLLNHESNVCAWAGEAFQPSGQGILRSEAGMHTLLSDSTGRIWTANPRSTGRWTADSFQPFWDASSSGTELRGATRAREGGVWVASGDSTRFWLRRITEQGVAAEHGPFPWSGRPIRAMLQGGNGRIWLGLQGGGIQSFDPAGGGGVLYVGSRQGLPNPFVTTLAEDREGNIWVGLQGGGLARLKPALFRKQRQQDGLSAEEVLAVTEGSEGEIWVGTNGEWLNRIKAGRIEHFGESQGLTHPEVWSVLADHENTLWAGTRGGGLFRLKDQRFEPFRPLNVEMGLFPGTPLSSIVLALFEDSRNNLWLGQQSFGTITRITQGEPVLLSIPEGPSNFDVRVITEDRNGAIWIGTHGTGLFRHVEDRFARYGSADGLRSEFIWALHVDSEGTLWVGTYQGGLSVLHGDRFLTLTTQEGLPSDVICQILPDETGDLWVGSYGGVFRLNRQQLEEFRSGRRRHVEPQVFTRADGLPSIECTGGFQPSGCRLRDGRLCFPTVKGLAIVDPSSFTTNQVPPIVQLEEIWIDGVKQWDSLSLGSAAPSVRRSSPAGLPGEQTVELTPGQTHLEVHYAGLSFSAPEQVRYRIRLSGLDQQWMEVGNRRHVDYQQLAPGTYRFEVMARNSDHVWSPAGTGLGIVVRPRFWQTNLFRIGAVLLLGTSVALLARLIEQRRQREKLAQLEQARAVEHERLRISQDIHDDLGARLTEITLLSEMVSEEAEADAPLQKDLQQISSKARDLTRSVDEIVWAVNPSNDNLESLVVYACSYAEDYLRATQIRCRFDLPTTIPRLPMRADVRHHLFLAFRESLTNVAKHSKATEVTVRFLTDDTHLSWWVIDNGKGWEGDQPPPSNRNGMKNMQRRMREIGGTCTAEKAPGGGVQILFRAPLPKGQST